MENIDVGAAASGKGCTRGEEVLPVVVGGGTVGGGIVDATTGSAAELEAEVPRGGTVDDAAEGAAGPETEAPGGGVLVAVA